MLTTGTRSRITSLSKSSLSSENSASCLRRTCRLLRFCGPRLALRLHGLLRGRPHSTACHNCLGLCGRKHCLAHLGSEDAQKSLLLDWPSARWPHPRLPSGVPRMVVSRCWPSMRSLDRLPDYLRRSLLGDDGADEVLRRRLVFEACQDRDRVLPEGAPVVLIPYSRISGKTARQIRWFPERNSLVSPWQRWIIGPAPKRITANSVHPNL